MVLSVGSATWRRQWQQWQPITESTSDRAGGYSILTGMDFFEGPRETASRLEAVRNRLRAELRDSITELAEHPSKLCNDYQHTSRPILLARCRFQCQTPASVVSIPEHDLAECGILPL